MPCMLRRNPFSSPNVSSLSLSLLPSSCSNLIPPFSIRRPRQTLQGPLSLPRPALPLSLSPNPSPHHHLHYSFHQVPPLLPRALSLSPPLQTQLPLLKLSPFSTHSSGEDDGSDPDPNSGSIKPEADRIYRIIEDLFANSDRNMEAVLSESGVKLTRDLVVGVLDRFRHAHRPAHRFFLWTGSTQDFSHDEVTYNKMLSVLGATRQFVTMVEFLEEMGDLGFLSMESLKIAIRYFAAAREMKKCVWVFQLMKKSNLDGGLETFNCLLDTLAKAKLGREAQMLFDKMQEQYKPDLRTYTALLLGWCKVRNLVEAGRVWNEMLDRGIRPDVVAHNTMIEGLIRGQRRPEAMKLFDLMKSNGPAPTVWTYTILIRDLCKGLKMDLAQHVFDEMKLAGCKPDAATYTCLILGFGYARKMHRVSVLLSEMTEMGIPPDAQAYNALIKLMTNRNTPDDAARIYKKMIKNGLEPTIHTYNMIMKSYFKFNYEMGCKVWEEMKSKGVCPDVNSYTVFIAGHIRHGRPDLAEKYIEEMVSKGMRAPRIDYNRFAADFSRAGEPDKLYELARKMRSGGKFEESDVVNSWAERMRDRVKAKVTNQTGHWYF